MPDQITALLRGFLEGEVSDLSSVSRQELVGEFEKHLEKGGCKEVALAAIRKLNEDPEANLKLLEDAKLRRVLEEILAYYREG